MENEKKENQQGMLTVEAIGSLIPFILIVMFIISLINFFMVHNKIQFALYQAGGELSGYTYFYQLFDLRDADNRFSADVKNNTGELKSLIGNVSGLVDDMESLSKEISGETIKKAETDGKAAIEDVRYFASDPKDIINQVAFYGAEKGVEFLKDSLVELIAGGMMENYIDGSFLADSPELAADHWLKSFGVQNGMDGFDFTASELFDDENHRTIDITVTYKLELFFLKILLKDPTVSISQRVVIPAWLDGDGTHGVKGL